jgi:hypothetical protein
MRKCVQRHPIGTNEWRQSDSSSRLTAWAHTGMPCATPGASSRKGLSLLQYFNYLQLPPVFSSKLNFATLHKLSRHDCSATSCMQEQSGVLAQPASERRPPPMHGRRPSRFASAVRRMPLSYQTCAPNLSVQLRQGRLPSLLETSRTYHQHLPTALHSAFVQLFLTTGAFGLRNRPDITLRDH